MSPSEFCKGEPSHSGAGEGSGSYFGYCGAEFEDGSPSEYSDGCGSGRGAAYEGAGAGEFNGTGYGYGGEDGWEGGNAWDL